MSRARPTVADVAAAAGVDPSTASRVLNSDFKRHRYNAQTIERVTHAAARLGYQPSRTARALRTGKNLLVGLVVSDIANQFFAELAARIERHVYGRGYRLLICNTFEQSGAQREHLTNLVAHGIDGLIVVPSGSEGCDQVIKSRIPLVTVDRPLARLAVPHIGLDNIGAGRQLGEHLRELGYRTVGVVRPVLPADPTIDQRLRGLEEGFASAGQVLWVHRLRTGEEHASAVRDLQLRLRPSAGRPEALVGLNNDATLVAFEAARSARVSIPDQVGVTGVDDFQAAPVLQPAVTVIAQPIESIAREAVDLLLGKPDSGIERSEPSLRLLPGILIRRGSLQPLERNTTP